MNCPVCGSGIVTRVTSLDRDACAGYLCLECNVYFIERTEEEMTDALYDATLDAVRRLFSDTSVSREDTRARMIALRDEINLMIESLEE